MKIRAQPSKINDFVTFAQGVAPLGKKAFKLACLAPLWLIPSEVVSQQSGFCLRPVFPVLPSDPVVANEYRAELTIEYDEFFSQSGDYINCLRDEESSIRQEITEAISHYQELLNLPR